MIRLTSNAIKLMQNNSASNSVRYVVEANNLKVLQDCMRLDIYDGAQKTKAILFITGDNMDMRKVGKPSEDGKYLVQINQYTSYLQKDKIYIQILRFRPLQPQKTRSDLSTPTVSVKKQVKVQQREPRTEKKSEAKSMQIQKLKIQERTQRQESSYKKFQKEQPDSVNDQELKRFQKISDLFPDLRDWQIIVRVTEKSYRQFNNKAGKFTKIFSMTLIDRVGMMIEGSMFGDSAKEYHDLIKVNGIYRMSRGQIREDNFNQNQSQDEKISKYTISFTRNSVFVPIADIPQIPRAKNSYVQLKDLVKETNFDKRFDLVGILLSIDEEKIIEKDGKSLFKKSLYIGDPQSLLSIEVVVWNKDLLIDHRWIDRTILLKNFKLHTFREALTINSFFKSQIRLETSHKFTQFEGKYQEKDYYPVSQFKDKNDQYNQPKDKGYKSIRELQNQISFLNSNQTIYSQFQVFITHMNFKGKWSYEACNNPKCKKSTQADTNCLNCGHHNKSTNRRFILPIEISDFTGSLWTTAFDELAQEIFKGIPIEHLSKLSENELRDEAQKRLYQQYKMKVSTKKQYQGNVKHNINGKALEISIDKLAVFNLQRIKKILDY